jgi:hypothetical protein
MLSVCRAVDDDPCPVSDRVLAQLYSADECSLRGLLDAIDPEIKPELAFYCYRRAHLESVGLVIAANCKESELVWLGGEAGTTLFARSRQSRDFLPVRPASPSRRKITLASGPLRDWTFVEEDDDALPSAAPA